LAEKRAQRLSRPYPPGHVAETAIAGSRLAVVADLGQGLPVGLVPKQIGVAAVRPDVVHHFAPASAAVGAVRMLSEEAPGGLLPARIVATLRRGRAAALARTLRRGA